MHEEIDADWPKLSSALIRLNYAKMLVSHVTNTKPYHTRIARRSRQKKPSAEPPEEPGWQAMSLSLSITAITSSLRPRYCATTLTTLSNLSNFSNLSNLSNLSASAFAVGRLLLRFALGLYRALLQAARSILRYCPSP
jgi:hypothetical protein